FVTPWIGRSHVTSTVLNRLPPRQRAEMITRVTEGKTLPKAIAEEIAERTDGIPLFIEELTKAVVESGNLADAGDHYMLTRSLSPLAIPTTRHASLLARLDRLAPVREVAQIGAALGRHFSHELISAVAPIPQNQLDNALAQLVRAELVLRRGTPPDAEYTFKHALVQDAAYSTLLRARRQQLHGRIAETLERQFREIVASEPALLARHCAEAGIVEKAVGYWLKAGQQALARSAMTEAASQIEKALRLLGQLPEGPGRQRWELDLQIALGEALTAVKGYAAAETGKAYIRARTICHELGDSSTLIRVAYGEYLYHLMRGAVRQSCQVATEILSVGEKQGSDDDLILGHRLLGVS